MCTPAIVPIISAVVGVAGQAANASAMRQYGEQQQQLTTDLANTNALASYTALQHNQIQQHAQASAAIQNVSERAAAARSTARVSAGESGVAGASVDALQSDFTRQELSYQTAVIRNSTFADQQITNQMQGVRAQQQAQIINAQAPPVQQPDFLNAFIGAYSKSLEIGYGLKKANDPNAKFSFNPFS